MKRNAESAAAIAASVCPGLISGVVSSPRRSGSSAAKSIPERIRIRRISGGDVALFQLQTLKGPKAFHENLDQGELESRLASLLGTVYSRGDFTLVGGRIRVLGNRRGELTAIRETGDEACCLAPAPTAEPEDVPDASPAYGHNRTKRYILTEGTPIPFLVDLGVMSADGRVIHAKYDKFRQINRFLEFIADVVPELTDGSAQELSIVDFGCGKSYLTFAVYHYLSSIRGLSVRITGLDLKEDVIEQCSLLAVKYGFTGLSFKQGDIAGFTPETPPDMVISLHACDTATDLALAQALRWRSRVILSVPCCQHELNALLSKPAGEKAGEARVALAGAFRHGIIRERLAALFTDARRAELLEVWGYRVQVLEFIDMSHTPKNLLIRAVRRTDSGQDGDAGRGIESALGEFLGEPLALERTLDLEQGHQPGHGADNPRGSH